MARLLAVLAVAGLAVGLSLSPAIGDHTKREKLHRVTTFIKLGDPVLSDTDGSGGPSDGDIQTFSLVEFDKEGGTQIGAGTVTCTLLKQPLTMCTASVTDGKGTIITTGQNNGEASRNLAAVTGGSGDYEKVRGSVKLIAKEGDPLSYTARARLYY